MERYGQTGPIESAKLEKSEEFDCSFTGDMVNEKNLILCSCYKHKLKPYYM
jgi:hypothetical protein